MANSRTTRINSTNTTFPTLESYVDRNQIQPPSFQHQTQQTIAVSNANFVVLNASVIDSPAVISSTLISITQNGILSRPSAGFGGGNTDAFGPALPAKNISICLIRDSSSLLPIVINGLRVFGLAQTTTATTDGTAVNSSNLQISFVTIDPITKDFQLQNINTTIDFAFSKNIISKEGDILLSDVTESVTGYQTLPTILVFQPGGTAQGNVFTSWQNLYNVLMGIQGEKEIEFDSSFSGGICTIPAGTWDMSDVTFAGFGISSNSTNFHNIAISDSCFLPNLTRFKRNISLTSVFTAGHGSPITFTSPNNMNIIIENNVKFFNNYNNLNIPFFDFTGAGNVIITIKDSEAFDSTFYFNGITVVMNLYNTTVSSFSTPNFPAIQLDGGAYATLNLFQGSTIGKTVSNTAGTFCVLVVYHNSSSHFFFQPYITSDLNFSLFDSDTNLSNFSNYPLLFNSSNTQTIINTNAGNMATDGRPTLVDTSAFSGNCVVTVNTGIFIDQSFPNVNFLVKDIGGNASNNNIILTPGIGDTIEGKSSYTVDSDYGTAELKILPPTLETVNIISIADYLSNPNQLLITTSTQNFLNSALNYVKLIHTTSLNSGAGYNYDGIFQLVTVLSSSQFVISAVYHTASSGTITGPTPTAESIVGYDWGVVTANPSPEIRKNTPKPLDFEIIPTYVLGDNNYASQPSTNRLLISPATDEYHNSKYRIWLNGKIYESSTPYQINCNWTTGTNVFNISPFSGTGGSAIGGSLDGVVAYPLAKYLLWAITNTAGNGTNTATGNIIDFGFTLKPSFIPFTALSGTGLPGSISGTTATVTIASPYSGNIFTVGSQVTITQYNIGSASQFVTGTVSSVSSTHVTININFRADDLSNIALTTSGGYITQWNNYFPWNGTNNTTYGGSTTKYRLIGEFMLDNNNANSVGSIPDNNGFTFFRKTTDTWTIVDGNFELAFQVNNAGAGINNYTLPLGGFLPSWIKNCLITFTSQFSVAVAGNFLYSLNSQKLNGNGFQLYFRDIPITSGNYETSDNISFTPLISNIIMVSLNLGSSTSNSFTTYLTTYDDGGLRE